MKFKIVNGKLILIDSSLNIVEGENNCQAIEIEIPQAYRGIDMTHLSFRFTVTSVADTSISACQVLYADILDDKKMLLYCAVTDDFSSIIGSVVYTLTGVDSNGTVAKFISIPHEITNDISTESISDKDAAKQLFNQAQLEVQKAVDAAERAEKASQTPVKIYPATDQKLGGIFSGNDISVSEDGTVTVQSVNGKTLGKSVPDDAVFTDTVYSLPIATASQMGGIKSSRDISVASDGTATVNSVNGKTVKKDVPENAVFTDTVYELPKATINKLGGVKVDGSTITIDSSGRISAAGRPDGSGEIILPKASTDILGGVKVDGTTIISDTDGVISSPILSEIKAYLGYDENDVLGLYADFENNVFTRIVGAVNKSAGIDFNSFAMYGGRRRCNVLDDGTITAYYGDANYIEDGSNGQVMVYQPKFYYKVVPLKLDPIAGGTGYHLRKANYYISATPKKGFKLHPAFYDEDGKPVDYILFSAYEGSIYDTSASAYLQNDEQAADFSADKLSSVACVKPCSGNTQSLTRVNIERLSKNRGTGWHIDTIKAASANQLLIAVEYASFNMQNTIGSGVVNITDLASENRAIVTGKTSSFGNFSAMSNGINGQASVSYRGMENPWGNIFKFINGINGYMDNNGIFHIYVCDDLNFSESKGTGNYQSIGYNPANTNGYVSAFGYSEEYDWLFVASETTGNNNLPIGDNYLSLPTNKNQWRVVLFGGCWYEGNKAGAFEYSPHGGIGLCDRAVGGRLLYIPASKL